MVQKFRPLVMPKLRRFNPVRYLNKVVLIVLGALLIEEAVSFSLMSTQDATLNFFLSTLVGVAAIFVGWFSVIKPLQKIIEGLAAEKIELETAKVRNRFELIFESLQEGVILIGADDQAFEINPSALRLLQIKPDAHRALTTDLLDSISVVETDSARTTSLVTYVRQVQLKGRTVTRTLEIVNQDGIRFWLRSRFHPIFSEDSTVPESVLIVLDDVTTEIESRTRLEVALKAGNLGVWDWHVQTDRLIWDRSMFRILDLDPLLFTGRLESFLNRVIAEDQLLLRKRFEDCVAQKTDFSAEFRIQRADGSIRVIRAESHGTYDSNGLPVRFVGVNWDITEYKEKDLKLIQASRLSSVGEMSAGIAHEINNPLAVIFGRASVLKNLLSKELVGHPSLEKALHGIDTIEKTAMRISTIIRGLKSFSRDGHSDPFETVSVSSLLSDALDFCASRFKNRGVDLRVSEIPENLTIECRQAQITQVVLNLLNNAFDAVSQLDHDSKWVQVELRENEDSIELAVTDCGLGIPASVRERLMQPFFTTKPAGQGTGLGLSISHGICVAHCGSLSLDIASPNTRFVVELPKVQKTLRTVDSKGAA